MKPLATFALALFVALGAAGARAKSPQQVVDLPTRPGVTLRMVTLVPADPVAAVVLISGGAGHLAIASNGLVRNEGNFLLRSRQLFADRGLAVLARGGSCERFSRHGFNGVENAVVQDIAAFMRSRP